MTRLTFRTYSSGELLLIGPKIEYTFSKSVFWIPLFNTVHNQKLGINSRLQWRFAPLSVYISFITIIILLQLLLF